MTYLASISYFCAALVFGALALFQETEILEIIVNDNYIVLPQTLAWIILAIIFVMFAVISLAFELAKKPFYRFLFLIHFVITIAGIVGLYYVTQEDPVPNQFVDYSAYEDVQNAPEPATDSIQWITYVLYSLAAAQVVFVVNFILSLFKARRIKKAQKQQALSGNERL